MALLPETTLARPHRLDEELAEDGVGAQPIDPGGHEGVHLLVGAPDGAGPGREGIPTGFELGEHCGRVRTLIESGELFGRHRVDEVECVLEEGDAGVGEGAARVQARRVGGVVAAGGNDKDQGDEQGCRGTTHDSSSR